ncbi:hypothetical protein Acr_14g0006130 [Actinidia rufa]|uniref:Uncharacterized protein n=1 Tax=Actinidia rufa TaxID=165716 RepID=A0A7J0FSQ9_9ERIC|nr:hypothetical protein Acr_14g0006130 [Actinidia rufa]
MALLVPSVEVSSVSCNRPEFKANFVSKKPPVKLSTKSLTKTSKEDEEKQNYHVNTGYAIRTLREEFPELFYKELAFDIYRFEFE